MRAPIRLADPARSGALRAEIGGMFRISSGSVAGLAEGLFDPVYALLRTKDP